MLTSLIFKITELLIPYKYFGIVFWDDETDYESILGYPEPRTPDILFMVSFCLLLIITFLLIIWWMSFCDDYGKYIKNKAITLGLACILGSMFYVLIGEKFVARIIFYIISLIIWITFIYNINNVYIEFNKAPNSEWDSSEKEKLTEVNFQTIKDLYKLSPQRFSIPNYYKDNLCFRNCSYTTDKKGKTEYSYLKEGRTYYLTVHKRIDFIKFYIWAFKLSKEKYIIDTSKKNTAQFKQGQENLKTIINQAQIDIDKIRKESEKEIQKAQKIQNVISIKEK